jgi:hypothetical protein
MCSQRELTKAKGAISTFSTRRQQDMRNFPTASPGTEWSVSGEKWRAL